MQVTRLRHRRPRSYARTSRFSLQKSLLAVRLRIRHIICSIIVNIPPWVAHISRSAALPIYCSRQQQSLVGMQTRVARTSVRSALAATRPQVTLRPLTVAQYDCMFGTTVGSGQAAVVDSRQLHVVRRTLARQHTTAFARNMSTAEGEKKAEADANAKSESKEETKSDSSAGASGQDSQAAKKPSRWYRLIEDAKDVLAVTFGYERKRDIGLEVDMGLREYPWVCYTDPATEKLMYRNNDTGVVTDIKPSDFDKRAKPSARLEVNHAASDIAVVKTQQTPWERTLNVMYNTPIIQGLLAVGETVAASPVGKAAEKVKAKVADVKEDLQEKWETSQHP